MSDGVEEIEVTINKDGTVSIKVVGMQGDACLATTKELEALLGGDVISRDRTDSDGSVQTGAQQGQSVGKKK